MSELKTLLPTDTWIAATWDEYIQAIEAGSEKAKGYYYKGQMRIEMSPVGSDHARDHAIVFLAVTLFATIKNININAWDNCTYRKLGVQEVQPDVSYYIGENVNAIPWGTSIIDLNIYPPPNLVIEIANTSLADDKGEKRLLYEELGVNEYWIVDVKKAEIIALAIADSGSKRITQSQVLPGLPISLLETALRRSREASHSQVCAWLLAQFQS